VKIVFYFAAISLTLIKACQMKANYLLWRSVYIVSFLLMSIFTIAQNNSQIIKGKVTDESSKPLEGATIEVIGTTNRTITKADGTFTITVALNSKLSVSSVGFYSQELTINNSAALNIVLKVFVNSMEDVVVVGYGTKKRSTLTSSVVSVNAEQIRSRPVANALEAIQGKAAGVDVTSSERPGTTGSIIIRGVRSITASNSPLYVVDGIPLNFGGVDAINPNDIESIDILKDASATAVYGSRGANGVVLVTTKKGKSGQLNLNYYATLRLDNLQDRMQMMNSAQYIEFRRDSYRRARYRATFLGTAAPAAASTYPDQPTWADDQRIFPGDPYALANIQKGWATSTWDGPAVPTTDWTGMVLRTGVTHDHNISVSGGTQKVKAYASFGYLSQTGVMLGQDFTRYTAKVNVDINPVKWFSMGVNIDATYGLQNYGYETTNTTGSHTIYAAAQAMLPYTIPFDSTGKRINLPGADVNILNPIGEDRYTINLRKTLRALTSVYAELQLYKGLKYRFSFSPDLSSYYNGIYMDSMSINRGGGVSGSTNRTQLNQTSRSSWTLNNLIYYDKTIATHHDIGVTLLQEALYNRSEASSMTAQSVLPSSLWYNLQGVSALTGYSSGLSENSLTSYMARVNYGYDNKYLLTAFVRWDGSSVLAQGHKWDMFPSVSAAWRLDREKFLQKVHWVNQLKLRAGLASVGNAAVSAYTTLGGLQSLYYTYGATVVQGYVASDPSSASPATYPDQNLGWEHTKQLNLAVDFSLFNSRLSGTIDVYSTNTDRLLMNKSIPSVNGYTYTLTNIGATSGKGIDITLNSLNIKKRNFSWSTAISFSASREKIVSLANGKVDDITNTWFIGQRVSVYYDYKKIGIWQEADKDTIAKYKANGNTFVPGDIRVFDKNGDNKIDANNDRMIVGHSQPDWTGGITNDFTYKNWGLSVFIYARWGFTMTGGSESLQGRYAQRQLNYWTSANPTNDYPAPNYASAAGDTYVSSMNYLDGSFIRIRNISLSYILPAATAKKIQLSNLKVYAQISNPAFIYSKVKFLDPDTGTSTYNKGFVLGINASF
jgi:TonB-linked SusC/RagA family outer membrane protein